jgi:hypothetical protein
MNRWMIVHVDSNLLIIIIIIIIAVSACRLSGTKSKFHETKDLLKHQPFNQYQSCVIYWFRPSIIQWISDQWSWWVLEHSYYTNLHMTVIRKASLFKKCAHWDSAKEVTYTIRNMFISSQSLYVTGAMNDWMTVQLVQILWYKNIDNNNQ